MREVPKCTIHLQGQHLRQCGGAVALRRIQDVWDRKRDVSAETMLHAGTTALKTDEDLGFWSGRPRPEISDWTLSRRGQTDSFGFFLTPLDPRAGGGQARIQDFGQGAAKF